MLVWLDQCTFLTNYLTHSFIQNYAGRAVWSYFMFVQFLFFFFFFFLLKLLGRRLPHCISRKLFCVSRYRRHLNFLGELIPLINQLDGLMTPNVGVFTHMYLSSDSLLTRTSLILSILKSSPSMSSAVMVESAMDTTSSSERERARERERERERERDSFLDSFCEDRDLDKCWQHAW